MLKCSTSLWSADLTNLAAEVRRVAPYSDRFHLDVADGHYTPTMLFFPDLVAALRPFTDLAFEVHLMTTEPLQWIDPFISAGADCIIFCFDSLDDPVAAVNAVKARGKQVGVSLLLEESVELVRPILKQLDILTIVGTPMGIKGASMDQLVPAKISHARQLIREHQSSTLIEADGGIRRDTVPLMYQAGVDYIVPGSLMFREDPVAMRHWLTTL